MSFILQDKPLNLACSRLKIDLDLAIDHMSWKSIMIPHSLMATTEPSLVTIKQRVITHLIDNTWDEDQQFDHMT